MQQGKELQLELEGLKAEQASILAEGQTQLGVAPQVGKFWHHAGTGVGTGQHNPA